MPHLRPLLMILLLHGAAATFGQGALLVEVVLPREGQGTLLVAACPDAASFTSGRGCMQRRVEAVRPATAVRFDDLPPGRYAVKAFLDINGNNDLDRDRQGLPGEPFGFSKDVLGKPSPVLFEKAAVTVPAAGGSVRFKLRGKPPARPPQ